jgi:hypothetical protein
LPGGQTLAELAREYSEAAVATLAEVMTDVSAPPAARVSAASALLHRGWGRAQQTVEVHRGPDANARSPEEDRATIYRFLERERQRLIELQ